MYLIIPNTQVIIAVIIRQSMTISDWSDELESFQTGFSERLDSGVFEAVVPQEELGQILEQNCRDKRPTV